jgi:hypothetical protein
MSIVALIIAPHIKGVGGASQVSKVPVIETLDQKISYGIGTEVGSIVLQSGMQLDKTILLRGIEDASSLNAPLLISEQEILMAFEQFQAEVSQPKVK